MPKPQPPQDPRPETAAEAPESPRSNPPGLTVVGIGASAGGLKALGQTLAHLPDDTGMAFVIVQHLDPKHESELSELLAGFTRMPVVLAAAELVVAANHVYVIPPNVTLTYGAGKLHLEPRDGRVPQLIDRFFKSLAEDRQSGAIGVILSGTGTDGTLGLEEIKAVGGVTIAQDEASAQYPGMPQSAFRSGCIDLVLTPEKIATELGRIARHPYVLPGVQVDGAAIPETDAKGGQRVLDVLQSAFGVDFGAYRETTIRRRVLRRMMLHTIANLEEYADLLGRDRVELEALYQDLLIKVTSFFRDPEVFEAIRTQVLPEIMRMKLAEAPIRVWVAGCSTGQEAYSLAMLLREFLDSIPIRPRVQIFATDLSDALSLVKAREGLYPESIATEISPERLARFFRKEQGGYRIEKELREMVIFARQNLASDPPFSHIDLITCRNVLIYLSPTLQKRILPTFHYALSAFGFLVLGASETIGEHKDLFVTRDGKHRIYSRSRVASHRPVPLAAADPGSATLSGPEQSRASRSSAEWVREADRIAHGQYVPPGVLVNENLDILQFRGMTGPYLAPSPGEPSHKLAKMAREGLFLELRSAVVECQRTLAAVRRHGVRIRSDGVDREIGLRVWPVQLPGAREQCYLILFEEPSQRPALEPAGTPETPPLGESGHLRQELAATREYLQAIIAQQEESNEKLKSASEEVQSSNQELQSSNQELATSKEELQSVNEELITVNEQLQNRNVEMRHLNDDLVNLINSADLPTVLVGDDYRIRRFTPAAALLLHLLPNDVGRAIANIRLPIDALDLDALVRAVGESGTLIEREIQDHSGHWHSLRIHPYRTMSGRIEGAVAVFVDIDTAKRAQAAVRESLEYADAIIQTAREPLVILDAKLCVRSANRAFYQTFKVDPAATEGKRLYELGNHEWDIPELRKLLEVILPQNTTFDGFEVTHDFAAIGPKVMVLNARRLQRGENDSELILLAIEDRTVSSHLKDELNLNVSRLSEIDRNRTVFLALLAHELRNPLAPIRNAIGILRRADDNGRTVAKVSDIIARQVDHMARLVDDLIDVNRISQGKITLQAQRMDLASVVDHSVEAGRVLARAMGLKLETYLPAAPLYVIGDPTRIGQIVGNLIENACKFSEPAGEITVNVARRDQHAILEVIDHGIGIDQDQLPRVFDMFMQVDTSLGRAVGGLGIGLALVKHLVTLHGGTIEALSSGLGKGATFRLALALAPDQVSAPADMAPMADTFNVVSPRRILIVDDNRDAATSLALLLELSGHDVHTAYDGLQALEAAARLLPDVVFLDIGLPGLTGYQIAARMRTQAWGRDLQLAALTGWGNVEDREESKRAGFDAHFVKPVNLDDVMAFIRDSPRVAK